jgi:hypothetical protein
MNAVNMTLSAVNTDAQIVPDFSADIFEYTLYNVNPSIFFFPTAASFETLCNVSVNGNNYLCSDNSLDNIPITQSGTNLTVQLAIPSDTPPTIFTYTFTLIQSLCQFSYTSLFEYPSSCQVTDNNTLALQTDCTVVSIGANVNILYDASEYCTDVLVQYFDTTDSTWTNCSDSLGCPLNNGTNAFQVVGVDMYNSSNIITAAINVAVGQSPLVVWLVV